MIQPLAESVQKVTNATVDGAAAILSRICLPAHIIMLNSKYFNLDLRGFVRSVTRGRLTPT